MSEPLNKLTNLISFYPFAEGTPGNRVFFIFAEGSQGKARIQLEKEQLIQLSLIIQELIADNNDLDIPSTTKDLNYDEKINLNIQLMSLEVKKDIIPGLYLFDIFDSNSKKTPIIQIYVSAEMIKLFAADAIKVCASGRPLCPLCGEPINPEGHTCPRTNGHIHKNDLEFEP